ncbi:unnamed protein product [Symbiodinium natans]|uniref:FHA domain-containing protein n=1 Tax=Symbiodinium natans TaxID=878477 RepID=A0A812UQ28_9DINO|nr:unnamed protein product [Symbiodinium natans]
MPQLLVEAWSSEGFLGEQWISPESVSPLQMSPMALFSRPDEGKPDVSTLDTLPNLELYFHADAGPEGFLIFGMQLFCMEPTALSQTPDDVKLSVWRWGCAGEGAPSARSASEVPGTEAEQAEQAKQAECWLEAINVGDALKHPQGDLWLQVPESEAGIPEMVLGRNHTYLKHLLSKDTLICVSREHLRLRFDPLSACLSLDNLSSNPVLVGGTMIPPGRRGTNLRNGDVVRLVAPSSLLPGHQGPKQPPSVSEMPLSEDVDNVGMNVPEMDGFEEDVTGLRSELAYLLSLRVHLHAEELRCHADDCRGGGGDPLYNVSDVSAPPTQSRRVLCWTCCQELRKNASLRFAVIPGRVLHASWDLLCQTDALATQRQDNLPMAQATPGCGVSWGVDFESAELRLPILTSFSRRALEAQTPDGCRVDGPNIESLQAELIAAEDEAEKSLGEVVDLAAQAGINPGETCFVHAPLTEPVSDPRDIWALQAHAATLKAEIGRLQRLHAESQMEVTPKDAKPAPCNALTLDTDHSDHSDHSHHSDHSDHAADVDSSEDCAEVISGTKNDQSADDKVDEDAAPAPKPSRRILHDAEPLRASGLDPEAAANHQRLMQLLRGGSGMLYKHELLQISSELQRPDFGDKTLTAGLTAIVKLQLVPAPGLELSRLHLELHADAAALHCECDGQPVHDDVLPASFDRGGSSFILEFELMEVLCQPPSLNLQAELTAATVATDEMASDSVQSCHLHVRLPVLITTFLEPWHCSFDEEWVAPDLQAASEQKVPSSVVMADAEVVESLSFGGALHCSSRAETRARFAARLREHGCTHEMQVVLVQLSSLDDGKLALAAKSQDLRLAEAVLAAVMCLSSRLLWTSLTADWQTYADFLHDLCFWNKEIDSQFSGNGQFSKSSVSSGRISGRMPAKQKTNRWCSGASWIQHEDGEMLGLLTGSSGRVSDDVDKLDDADDRDGDSSWRGRIRELP